MCLFLPLGIKEPGIKPKKVITARDIKKTNKKNPTLHNSPYNNHYIKPGGEDYIPYGCMHYTFIM